MLTNKSLNIRTRKSVSTAPRVQKIAAAGVRVASEFRKRSNKNYALYVDVFTKKSFRSMAFTTQFGGPGPDRFCPRREIVKTGVSKKRMRWCAPRRYGKLEATKNRLLKKKINHTHTKRNSIVEGSSSAGRLSKARRYSGYRATWPRARLREQRSGDDCEGVTRRTCSRPCFLSLSSYTCRHTANTHAHALA